jgi:hypothetical protein
MNDFLNRLAAERQKTDHEKIWRDWSKAHVADGHEVWDASGSSEISASISAFLRLVPQRHFEEGLVLTAPRYLHDTMQAVPGVVRTNDRFVELKRASKEMRSAWQREGVRVGFVRAVRTYYDEGYKCTREHLVLADGRITGLAGLHFPSEVDELYEAMAQFVVANNL